jgi:hypothetical protein
MAEPIEDIELSSPSKKIYISPASINSLDEQEVVNVTISSAESFNSSIELTYKNSSVNFPVTIAITSNESGVSTNIPIINEGNSCASLGGKLCNFLGGEECVGTQKSTLDGICCIGSCAAPSSATKAWLWGLVILVLVAVGGWYLYRKQKLMPKSAKPGEIIKKRTEQFKERMLQDQHKAPEVKKSLTKI